MRDKCIRYSFAWPQYYYCIITVVLFSHSVILFCFTSGLLRDWIKTDERVQACEEHGIAQLVNWIVGELDFCK